MLLLRLLFRSFSPPALLPAPFFGFLGFLLGGPLRLPLGLLPFRPPFWSFYRGRLGPRLRLGLGTFLTPFLPFLTPRAALRLPLLLFRPF